MNAAQVMRLIKSDVDAIGVELTEADERSEAFGNRKGETGMERHEYCAAMFGDHELPKLLVRVATSRRTLAEAIASGAVAPGGDEAELMDRALNFTHAKILHYAAVNWSAAGATDKATRANREGLALLQNATASLALGLKGRLQADLGLRDEAIATYREIAEIDDGEDGTDALRAIRALESRPAGPTPRATPSISPVLGMIVWGVVIFAVIRFLIF